MAFPTSITGTVFLFGSSQGRNRPWIAGGNVYYIARDGTNADDLVVQKATDPTDSFTEVASLTVTGAGTGINGLATILDGTDIHVITFGDLSGTLTMKYHVFDTTGDTFSISNEDTTFSLSGANAPATTIQTVDIDIRSDGDIVIFYMGEKENIMGTRYHRVYYARREGTTWTIDVAVDDGGEQHSFLGGMVVGEADKMHFVWSDDPSAGATDADVEHKSLTSGNSLSAADTLNDNTADETAGANRISIAPVYYDSSGVERITTSWMRDSNQFAVTSEVDDDGTPGAEENASDVAVFNDGTTIRTACMVLAADFDDMSVHLLYGDDSTRDLQYDTNDDGGGWGTDTEEVDALTMAALTSNIYQRGSDIVLAMVYNGGSGTQYREKVLRTITPTGELLFFHPHRQGHEL